MKIYKLQSKNNNSIRYAADLDEVVEITSANRKFAGGRLNRLSEVPLVLCKGYFISRILVDESSIKEQRV